METWRDDDRSFCFYRRIDMIVMIHWLASVIFPVNRTEKSSNDEKDNNYEWTNELFLRAWFASGIFDIEWRIFTLTYQIDKYKMGKKVANSIWNVFNIENNSKCKWQKSTHTLCWRATIHDNDQVNRLKASTCTIPSKMWWCSFIYRLSLPLLCLLVSTI